MQKIKVNGLEIEVPDGASFSIVGGEVRIGDSVVHNIGSANVVIGSLGAKFILKCDKDVLVEGDVSGGIEAQNVTCRNVTGGIEAKGDVKCSNVTGGIEARDVVCSGNVTGGIEAQNFSRG